ncbi:MAG TPA: hypothetical protein VH186_05920 [Chloroflexia bacterium]|nr:hypothetical protein [Chloroflexia bacterium]
MDFINKTFYKKAIIIHNSKEIYNNFFKAVDNDGLVLVLPVYEL